jgi:predicted O-linked N-acetylglucosamine transferase (SPINDLY family)
MNDPVDALRSVLAFQQLGDHAKAIARLQRLLRSHPDHADALNLLAISLHAIGEVNDALTAIRKAISVRPDAPGFHTNAGVFAVATGDFAAGMAHYRRALELDPECADACNNLGAVLLRIGRPEQAELALRRALEIEPDSANARVNLGNVLRGLGREDEAIACYRRAIELSPDLAEAHNNLGNIRKSRKQFCEAIRSFDRALALRPRYSEARYNRGLAQAARGDVDAAKTDLEAAIALNPDPRYRLALAGLMPTIPRSIADIDLWRKHFWDSMNELLVEGVTSSGDPLEAPVVNFHLAYHGENDRDLLCLLSRVFRQMFPKLKWTAPWISEGAGPRREGPIRLGVFSTFLGDHAVTWTLRGLLESISSNGIELTLFTGHRTETRTMPELAAVSERIIYIPNSLERARELIASEQPDVLVYADIGMENPSYLLAHARIAPVQCALWGHPETTGISTVDYFISNDTAEPEGAERHYCEQLVRLGGLQTCYRRPEIVKDDMPEILKDLPGGATSYMCPQSLIKIHPEMDYWLAEILRQDPKGVLVLFAQFDGDDRFVTERLLERWVEPFAGVIDRVFVLPRVSVPNFLSILTSADVLLDTWPFGGGNTSYQGFAAHRPIVTLPDRFLRGRGTLALYRHMGISECIAQTPEEYVKIAVRLGTDPEYNQHITGLIQKRSDVLFDDRRVGDDFLAFLTEIVK